MAKIFTYCKKHFSFSNGNRILKRKIMIFALGGSPGLVVMGDYSSSKGCGFKSWRHILEGHFPHLFVVKMYFLLEKTKINKKEAGVGPYLKNDFATVNCRFKESFQFVY